MTTTAFGIVLPSLTSITVPPTSAIRSFSSPRHARAPTQRSAPASLRLITRRMVMENFPAFRVMLHEQSEWTARGGAAVAIEDVPGGHQGEIGRDRTNVELFESETVALGAGSEHGRVIIPDEVKASAEVPSRDEGRQRIGRIIGHESLEI